MEYTLGDRMRDVAKAYKEKSKAMDQLEKEIAKTMFEDKSFRASFRFDIGEQTFPTVAKIGLIVILDSKCKDDYYGTIEYTPCITVTFYLMEDTYHEEVVPTVDEFNMSHYDWFNRAVLIRFLDLVDNIKKIRVLTK